MYFATKMERGHQHKGGEKDLLDLYILNLIVTLGMFAVLIFRAWIEQKHYRMMWQELEWRRIYQTMGRLLKAEKDLFSRVEGGDELYQMLCEIFKANEERKN
ncbi:MAG: hypothetical protein QXQ94_02590 [Candidatus Bathyarchaeia archaeon]